MDPKTNFINMLGKYALGAAGSVVNPIIDLANKAQNEVAANSRNQSGKGNLLNAIKNAAGATGSTVASPEAGRAALDVASTAIPFGKGANIATRAIIPGAVVGGLSESAQPGATPQSIAGSAVAGAALPAVADIGKGIMGKVAGTADDLGNKFYQSQYDPKPTTASRIDIPTAVKKLSDYGFTSLKDVAAAHPQVTGANGILTQITKGALKNSNPVDMTGIDQTVNNLASDPVNVLAKPDQVQKLVDRFNKADVNNGSIVNGDPLSVFKLMQQFEGAASNFKASQDDSTKALGRIYQGVANQLEDKLFTGAGANQALPSVLTPDMLSQVAKISPKLAQEVAGAKTVGEVRSLAAPFVQMGKVADETMTKDATKGISLKDMVPLAVGLGTGNWGGLGLAAADSNMGKNFLGNISKGIAGAGNAATKGLPPITGQIAGQTEARLPSLLLNNHEVSDYSPDGQQNPSHIADSISGYAKDVKFDNSGHYTLPQSSSPITPLTPGTPEYIQAQAALPNNTRAFMTNAPLTTKAVNRVVDDLSSMPLNILTGFKNNQDLLNYASNPQNPYAKQVADLDGMNKVYASAYQNVMGQAPDNSQLITPGLLPDQLQQRFAGMLQFINDSYGQYYQPYAQTSATPTGNTDNGITQYQKPQAPQSAAGMVQQNFPSLPPLGQ